jgi:putative holliday junction resolvase
MTIAALDFGRRWIGLAVSDPDGRGAYPVTTIERRSLVRDLEHVAARLRDLEVTHVVVGLPLNMDGSVGPQAHAAENFARSLKEATGLAVDLYDERLSSFEAEQRLRSYSRRRRRTKIRIDALAAAVILEGWLQQKSRTGVREHD